jgi:Mn-dependent DtxR family transcriptional regulator
MPYDDFPRMFLGLPAETVSEALGKLEAEGLLRMVHYGSLSWYVISRKRIGVSSRKRDIL